MAAGTHALLRHGCSKIRRHQPQKSLHLVIWPLAKIAAPTYHTFSDERRKDRPAPHPHYRRTTNNITALTLQPNLGLSKVHTSKPWKSSSGKDTNSKRKKKGGGFGPRARKPPNASKMRVQCCIDTPYP